MIKTETAKKYGGTKAIPLTEFDFIVPEKRYIIQDAEIDNEKCLIISFVRRLRAIACVRAERAYSLVVRRVIRIDEAPVRFRLGPPFYK